MSDEKPPLMFAEFLLPADRVRGIAEHDAQKSGSKIEVDLQPRGNGAMTLAVGPIQPVMFLIGAVAAEGEAALYRAGLV